MGIFKKKSDPITDRAKALQSEIAALESQIKRLASTPPKRAAASPAPAITTPVTPAPAPAPAKRPESIFESVSHQRVTGDPPTESAAGIYNEDLGVRKYNLGEAWRKLTNHFRGPPANNPKLVNYLAAGSIQGLRPLRFEKRVARNRFLFLFFGLLFLLIGIVSFFIKHR